MPQENRFSKQHIVESTSGLRLGFSRPAKLMPISDSSTHWAALVAELDEWSRRGLTARFWARDDDAIALTPQLDKLITFANTSRLEIALAVVPGRLTAELTAYLLAGKSPLYPMCHGWRHINYCDPRNPSEFGPERPLSQLIEDASDAYRAFAASFCDVPAVFVPPFARIAPALVAELPRIGFRGVSTGPGKAERRYARLASHLGSLVPHARIATTDRQRLDVHIDPFDWGAGSARSARSVERELIGYLRIRRNDLISVDRPIGLLLHHLAFDDPTWLICQELLKVLSIHPAVAWLTVKEVVESSLPASLKTSDEHERTSYPEVSSQTMGLASKKASAPSHA